MDTAPSAKRPTSYGGERTFSAFIAFSDVPPEPRKISKTRKEKMPATHLWEEGGAGGVADGQATTNTCCYWRLRAAAIVAALASARANRAAHASLSASPRGPKGAIRSLSRKTAMCSAL